MLLEADAGKPELELLVEAFKECQMSMQSWKDQYSESRSIAINEDRTSDKESNEECQTTPSIFLRFSSRYIILQTFKDNASCGGGSNAIQ